MIFSQPADTTNSVLSYSWDTDVKFVADETDPKLVQESNAIEHARRQVEITKLCLCLACEEGKGVFTNYATVIPDESVPNVGNIEFGYRVYQKMQQTRGKFSQAEFERADEAIGHFDKLDKDLKEKITVCLRFLNNFGSQEELQQRAVDLRVCLDAVFFEKEDVKVSEFKKRVKVLKIEVDGQELSGKKIDKVYDTCCQAVHTGKFDDPDNALDHLNRGEAIARYVIWKILQDSKYPEWAILTKNS